MLFCLSAQCICTHAVYSKGHPLWLLSHCESTCHTADMTLFECTVYMWWELQRAAHMTKWLVVSMQPTNRPVLSQTGSWEQQRRCLVSSASSVRLFAVSLPRHSAHVWRRARLRAGRLFWFSLCDTSVACHIALCPSVSWARPVQNVLLVPSVGVYNRGSCLPTGRRRTHHAEGQEALQNSLCTCAACVTSH